jgi:sensor domain CHASE-containing protein
MLHERAELEKQHNRKLATAVVRFVHLQIENNINGNVYRLKSLVKNVIRV